MFRPRLTINPTSFIISIILFISINLNSQEVQIIGELTVDSVDMQNGVIKNVKNPILSQDVTTKFYVDSLFSILSMANGLQINDIEGNKYYTTKIGSQVWMAENLRTTKYNDGTPIPLVEDSLNWVTLESPGYCWYKNDSMSYANPFGAYYNYYALADTNQLKICPDGWHIPSQSDWMQLIDYLGGVDLAGGKLKSTGDFYWFMPNVGATNETSFNAMGTGFREYDIGYFGGEKNSGNWWSSTEIQDNKTWIVSLHYNYLRSFSSPQSWTYGLSVRCIKY